MFKKISIVTAMSTALLVGGGVFTNTVDAAAHTDNPNQQQHQSYKVSYSFNSFNGGNFSNLDGNFNDFLQNYFANYQVNWNNQQAEPVKNSEEKEQTKEQPAQKQAAPKQEATKAPAQEQEAPTKAETQEQEAPTKAKAQEQAAPTKAETQEQQAPAKTEAPAEQQPATEQQQTQAQSDQLNAYEQQVVELTNNERVERGLNPLKIDVELSKMAHEKSHDMSANNYFAHTSPNYGSPFDMMASWGITYRHAGENIARGQRTPEEVVNAWMHSPGHRANILNPDFTYIGVGYVADGNYWTQEFTG